jgi:hypothetical protein
MISSRKEEPKMKHFTTTALMLGLGVASVYAQERVNMTFSGIGGPSAIDLKQRDSNNVEENVAGNGTLGSFTFRDVRAAAKFAQPSTSCLATFFPSLAGGGIFRFQDGSLLKVGVKGGGDCIDFGHLMANCTLILEVQGGTGRFQHATGDLTYTEAAAPVLFDAEGHLALGTEVGQITGTISGLDNQEDQRGGR